MGSPCTITSFTDNTGSSDSLDITCTIPTNADFADTAVAVAGVHKPKVHFAGIGFAIYDGGLTDETVTPTIDLSTTLEGSLSGGSLLTIPGTKFGFSLDRRYGTAVTVGGEPCTIESLSNHEIICRNSPD